MITVEYEYNDCCYVPIKREVRIMRMRYETEVLSDGSKVYNIILCDKVKIMCDSEKEALALYKLILGQYDLVEV